MFCLYYMYRMLAWCRSSSIGGGQIIAIPVAMLCTIILYVMPLGVAALRVDFKSTALFRDVHLFYEYIPTAILLVCIFMFVFVVVYRSAYVTISKRANCTQAIVRPKDSSLAFKLVWITFFVLSVVLILRLANYAGGFSGLLLSGYAVTSLLSENSSLAIGFSWMATLSVLGFSYALVNRSKTWLLLSLGMIVICGISFLVMGRRGVLVVYSISLITTHALSRARLSVATYAVLLTSGFVFMNLLGLLRGASYESFSSFFETITNRYQYISKDADASYLYTLTQGNFVIPFQTLPNIISNMDSITDLSFGSITLKGFLLLIPSAIWSERPLPLANWYMLEYVDPNAALNEGRQFFFLSESYLNFGAFGAVIWGVVYGIGLAFITSYFNARRNSAVHVALFALLLGNVLSFIASDTVGGSIAFFKNYGLPCVTIIALGYALRPRLSRV